MKFRVQVTSLWTDNAENIFNAFPILRERYKIEDDEKIKPFISISTFKDLLDIIDSTGQPIIIFPKGEEQYVIEIYDDYRE